MNDYFEIEAISASQLKTVYSGSYWKSLIKRKPTPAMELGSLIHTAVLEPELLYSCYGVFVGDRRTKQGKLDWQNYIDNEIKPVTGEQMEMAQEIAKQVAAEPYLLFDECEIEHEYFFSHFGESCKSKIDAYHAPSATLIDLKTISDINKAERQFFDLHYDLQLAFYRLALQKAKKPVKQVQVLFVETQAPYTMRLFDLSTDIMNNGWFKVETAVEKLKMQRMLELDRPPLEVGEMKLPYWLATDE